MARKATHNNIYFIVFYNFYSFVSRVTATGKLVRWLKRTWSQSECTETPSAIPLPSDPTQVHKCIYCGIIIMPPVTEDNPSQKSRYVLLHSISGTVELIPVVVKKKKNLKKNKR